MESRRNAAMTTGASSRTDTSVPSPKKTRVEPTETWRTWVTASTLMYVDASSALKWSTTHFATLCSLPMHIRTPRYADVQLVVQDSRRRRTHDDARPPQRDFLERDQIRHRGANLGRQACRPLLEITGLRYGER